MTFGQANRTAALVIESLLKMNVLVRSGSHYWCTVLTTVMRISYLVTSSVCFASIYFENPQTDVRTEREF